MYDGPHKFGDTQMRLQLALNNGINERKYECVMKLDVLGEKEQQISDYKYEWKLDECTDYNPYNFPLLLPVI